MCLVGEKRCWKGRVIENQNTNTALRGNGDGPFELNSLRLGGDGGPDQDESRDKRLLHRQAFAASDHPSGGCECRAKWNGLPPEGWFRVRLHKQSFAASS
jgi:hypothetical protein